MKLREQLNKLIADIEAMFAKAKAEKREFTAEEEKAKDQMFADAAKLRKEIVESEKLSGLKLEDDKAKVADAFATAQKALEGTAQKPKAQDEVVGGDKGSLLADYDNFTKAILEAPGDGRGIPVPKSLQYVRNEGFKRQNFVITTGVDSGNLVPRTTLIPSIVRRMYNSFLAAIVGTGYSPIMTATAETLVIPVVDDTSVTGDTPAEDATTDAAADPSISNLTLGATLFSSETLWLSNTMLLTLGFDLVGYLMPILDKRVELKQDLAWITKLLAKVAGGNTVTTASPTAITYNEVVNTYHKVPIPYRTDAAWVVGDDFLKAVRQLTDDEHRPLFNMLDPLLNAGAIGTLMGRPVFTSLNMPSLAAGHVIASLVSGECLKARYVTNRRIAKYAAIPTYPDQVGFRLFENADADINTAGLAFLKTAAS